ncbi:Late competence development protein ComFB [Halothece sp. PCC 7418]|uniref:late competence development ComFB family protein n=1 Tax=Halothece sp. (strain PCC 7418) TaxID=65093 RepID=UPI0002A08229|nr:late competence development ComFB family protein [Halothece sp. PCC 7418]AFZ44154.1 Late competence development protein ComFB [Halothece sp. PCC 7418]
MSDYQTLNHRYLFTKLSKYARNGFTGRLSIKVEYKPSWRIYFSAGSIIWASGGIHPVRRWLRQLKGCHCQMTVPLGMTEQELLSAPYECWDYLALSLLMQENYINSDQVKSIVEGAISEVLFDIVQGLAQISKEDMNQVKMLRKPEVHPCNQELLLPAWMWRTESAKQRVLNTWETWLNAGLTYFSPDAGIIANQEELETQELHSLAQYFLNIEREEKTLRDLAMDNQTTVLSILQTMKKYLDQHLIQFNSVPDLWKTTSQKSQNHVGSHLGHNTILPNHKTDAGIDDELTQAKPTHHPSLRTPMSGWLKHSRGNTISGGYPSEEGVKVNVMETLVAQEVEQQLKALPRASAECITKLDVITYALNRLPPLYAASKEGIAHQKEEAKQKHQQAIKSAVKRAITAVQRDPIRRGTRIQSPNDVSAEHPH